MSGDESLRETFPVQKKNYSPNQAELAIVTPQLQLLIKYFCSSYNRVNILLL